MSFAGTLGSLTFLGLAGIPLLLLVISLVAAIWAAYLGWNYGGKSGRWPSWVHALLGLIFNWLYLVWYYFIK